MRQGQEPDPRLERAAVQMTGLGGEQGREDSSKGKTAGQDWVPRTFETLRKVFSPAKFNQEHEKRFKGVLRRAASEDVALAAIERMWLEGVRYPTGYDLRLAIDREHQRLAQQRPLEENWGDDWHVPACCPGSFDEIGFKHWWDNHATPELQETARRAASGLGVMARWVKAAEA